MKAPKLDPCGERWVTLSKASMRERKSFFVGLLRPYVTIRANTPLVPRFVWDLAVALFAPNSPPDRVSIDRNGNLVDTLGNTVGMWFSVAERSVCHRAVREAASAENPRERADVLIAVVRLGGLEAIALVIPPPPAEYGEFSVSST